MQSFCSNKTLHISYVHNQNFEPVQCIVHTSILKQAGELKSQRLSKGYLNGYLKGFLNFRK